MGGAWICSAFRNEGAGLASSLITQAVAATRARWPDVPELGMVTFLDRDEVKPIRARRGTVVMGPHVLIHIGKPYVTMWGRTWILAGFKPDGETKGGLLAFRLCPCRMPPPEAAVGSQATMF